MRNTASNGHGKRSPRAMASTASERSSTLPWQMSMIESSGGGVGGGVSGEVGDEVCSVLEVSDEVCGEVGDEFCGVLEVGDEVGGEVGNGVGGVLEVGTHTPRG